MRMELQTLAKQMGSLETEREEHRLVVESLKPLEPSRKCFRLMNGVLVQRSVEDVLPELQMNISNMEAVLNKLAETYKTKEKAIVEFQQEYQLRVESAPGAQQKEQQARNANVALA